MNRHISRFERIVRLADSYSIRKTGPVEEDLHPFDTRNIHPVIESVCRQLFDDGHYSQATFEAYKLIDQTVASIAALNKTGFKLMMEAFNESSPRIRLTNLSNQSEIDEQKGYSFLFAGSVMAIRNPRGHLVGNLDAIDQCLDHLAIASSLMRRIDNRELDGPN